MVSTEIQQIIDFVEGRIEPKAFKQLLYANPRFEAVLNNDPNLAPSNYVWPKVYLYVIQQNFDSAWDVLNAHGALTEFLERNEFKVNPTRKHHEFHDLVLTAQPKWLDVDLDYVQREIMPEAGELSGAELKSWLRAELRKRFQFTTSPPRWIQNPCWPIGDNGPLIFLGQIPVKDLFQDEAAVYVFYDHKAGRCQTIIQAY